MIFRNFDNRLYLHRHIHGRRSQLVPCRITTMTRRNAAEAVNLHNRVANGLSRKIYIPSDDETIVRYLGDDGVAVGVWFEDKLICLRTAQTGSDWVSGSLREIEVDPAISAKPAMTGFCVVDSEFRGNNIQFFSYYMLENMIADEFESLFSTVAPINIFSLQNILACNFYIVGIGSFYGGNLRYVVRKRFGTAPPLMTRKKRVLPIRNTEQQKKLISDGFVGYKIMRRPSGFSILYAPVGPVPKGNSAA